MEWLKRMRTERTKTASRATAPTSQPTQNLELITADTVKHCREQYLHEVQNLEYGQLIAKYNIDPLDILVWQLQRGFQGQQDHLQAIQRGEYRKIVPIDLNEAYFITSIAGTVVDSLVKEGVITQFMETVQQDQQYMLKIIAETYQKP